MGGSREGVAGIATPRPPPPPPQMVRVTVQNAALLKYLAMQNIGLHSKELGGSSGHALNEL